MDYAFPVNHHIHPIDRHIKQPGGFHDFQALIHHGGAVNGDLRSHVPIRMLQSLFRGNLLQLFHALSEKRAAGSG